MTVNTLGTDPELGGGPFAPGAANRGRTVAELLWPFFAGGVGLFAISALFSYHFHQHELEPTRLLQRAIAGVYHGLGLAPSVLFFLMVSVSVCARKLMCLVFSISCW